MNLHKHRSGMKIEEIRKFKSSFGKIIVFYASSEFSFENPGPALNN